MTRAMMEAIEMVQTEMVAIWNPNMNEGEWEIFEDDMITYEATDHEGMMVAFLGRLGYETEEIDIDKEMEAIAREWLVADEDLDVTTVANSIMGIQEGYRCEQEDVPSGILAWAMVHEDGDR